MAPLAKDCGDLKVVSFGESLPTPMFGIDVNFVEQKSANLGIGEYYQIKTNHINVCKPDSKDSIIYRKFIDLVVDVLADNPLKIGTTGGAKGAIGLPIFWEFFGPDKSKTIIGKTLFNK